MKTEEINYGILSDVSKTINYGLGDRSGRTVSRRTTQGFKRAFNINDSQLSDQNAEHIIHGAMVGTAVLLKSKKNANVATGLLTLACLFALYHAGK